MLLEICPLLYRSVENPGYYTIVLLWECCILFIVAEEVLAQLNDQLNKRKAQVQDAGDKLAQIQQAIVDQVQN